MEHGLRVPVYAEAMLHQPQHQTQRREAAAPRDGASQVQRDWARSHCPALHASALTPAAGGAGGRQQARGRPPASAQLPLPPRAGLSCRRPARPGTLVCSDGRRGEGADLVIAGE